MQKWLEFASHADVVASIISKAGQSKFTAMDYFDKIQIQHNVKYQGGKGFAQEDVKFADEKLKDDEAN